MRQRIFVAAFFAFSVVVIILTLPALAQDSSTPDFSGNNPNWVQSTNSQCWAYNYSLGNNDPTFTWSGNCEGHLISGYGVEQWYTPNTDCAGCNTLDWSLYGTFSDGVLQGLATLEFYSGGGGQNDTSKYVVGSIVGGVPSTSPAVPETNSVPWDAGAIALMPIVQGASPVGAPTPPPFNMPLNGFGDFTFGMTSNDAINADHSLTEGSSQGVLTGSVVIGGITYNETISFSFTAIGQLNDVYLDPNGQNQMDTSGNQQCGSDQSVFDILTKNYGRSQTERDNGVHNPGQFTTDTIDFYDYVWTFANGATITERNSSPAAYYNNFEPCPTIDYAAPPATPKNRSF